MNHILKERINDSLCTSLIRKFVLLFLVLYVTATSSIAQVSIGSVSNPVAGVLLELKDVANPINVENAYRSLGLPRVNLTSRKELYPMFLNDPTNSSSGATDNSTNNASWGCSTVFTTKNLPV